MVDTCHYTSERATQTVNPNVSSTYTPHCSGLLLCSHSTLTSRDNCLKYTQGVQTSEPGLKPQFLPCVSEKELSSLEPPLPN